MRTVVRALIAAVLAAGLACAAGAVAGEQSYSVRSGDSASSIAVQFYGDKTLGDLLLRYNGKTGTVIHAGDKLKIPACEVHKVGKGDTWSVLSTKYLGRTSVFPVVAALNGFTTSHALQVGESIVMPVVLNHKLERGEALSSLAERYYADVKLAGVIQVFNDLDDQKLSVGQTIQVPIVTLLSKKSRAGGLTPPKSIALGAPAAAPPKAIAAKPPAPEPKPAVKKTSEATTVVKNAGTQKPTEQKPVEKKPVAQKASEPKPAEQKPVESKQPAPTQAQKQPEPEPHVSVPPASVEIPKEPEPAPKTEAPAEPAHQPPANRPLHLEAELASASKAFADGNYPRARQILESMRERTRTGGSNEEKAAVSRLLAFVYVAYDMKEAACTAYQSAATSGTHAKLDADLVSPKIRKTLAGCAAGKS